MSRVIITSELFDEISTRWLPTLLRREPLKRVQNKTLQLKEGWISHKQHRWVCFQFALAQQCCRVIWI